MPAIGCPWPNPLYSWVGPGSVGAGIEEAAKEAVTGAEQGEAAWVGS